MSTASAKTAARGQAAKYSEAEWRSRVECAAGHHLLEHYGLTDMVEGVLGLRVEGEPDAYLLKPYRTFFDEVKASGLIKVRFDEDPDAGPGKPLNYSSCAQARVMLQSRRDVNCVLHTHIPASTVVATIEGGLRPVIQHALIVWHQIVYADCDIGNDEEAVRDIAAKMGAKKIALIRNHGVMIAGKNVAEVLFLTITLEYACRCQLSAYQTGKKVFPFDAEAADALAAEFTSDPNNEFVFDGTLQWQGWLRKLDRAGSCYRE